MMNIYKLSFNSRTSISILNGSDQSTITYAQLQVDSENYDGWFYYGKKQGSGRYSSKEF